MPDQPDPFFNRQFNLERLVLFSDAVIAIAITLLALDLRPSVSSNSLSPLEFSAQLAGLFPKLFAFLVSFFAISIYWISHHRTFGYIRRYDGVILLLNLGFLLFVVLLPSTTTLNGVYGYEPVAVALYALNLSACGVMMTSIIAYATYRRRLVDPALPQAVARNLIVRNLSAVALFLLSIPFAFWQPSLVTLFWFLVPVLSPVLAGRLSRG